MASAPLSSAEASQNVVAAKVIKNSLSSQGPNTTKNFLTCY